MSRGTRRLRRGVEALRTGELSERRQVGEVPHDQTTASASLSDAEKQRISRVLGYIDLRSIADQVVDELDQEYPPMDESFDAVTARRAANLALSKVVEKITGLTEGER